MKKQLLFFFVFTLCCSFLYAIDNQVVWTIDNLTSIGGYTVTTYGNPTVKTIDGYTAVEFDGIDDRIHILNNPLGSATEFTIEVILKPYDAYDASNPGTNIDNTGADINQPRFLHIEEFPTSSNKRITIELRLNPSKKWYLDTFIKSVVSSGQMDATKVHPVDEWSHVAMTYGGGFLKGYVNGIEQTSAIGSSYTGLVTNAIVSLGGRMNNRYYLKGAIRKVIFTPTALTASQFTYEGTVAVKNATYEGYVLAQNAPNPVTTNTIISYTLAHSEQIRIELFNSMGKRVQTLVDGVMSEGTQEVTFNKGNLPAGMYFYTITTASGYRETKKMSVR